MYIKDNTHNNDNNNTNNPDLVARRPGVVEVGDDQRLGARAPRDPRLHSNDSSNKNSNCNDSNNDNNGINNSSNNDNNNSSTNN